MPWPKLPAVAQTTRELSGNCDTAKQAPRALKEPIGFKVSTLTVKRQPSWVLKAAHSNCGVLRNTGSMTLLACAMRAGERRV